MSTRAQQFRYAAERSGEKRKPASETHSARDATKPRNPSPRTAKRSVYALEESTGRPSRKSTRRAANRQKTDVQFRMKRRVGEGRPRGP